MLNIECDKAKSVKTYILSGTVEETDNFEKLFGKVPGSVCISCLDIKRINSVGVKNWREYFSCLRAKSVKLRFFDLSPAMVSTLNYIKDFIMTEEITSVCAPFLCEKCNKSTFKVYTIEDLRALKNTMPDIVCSNCGSAAEFDELPEEYFAFLE